MIYQMVAVYDSAVASFMTPNFLPHAGLAIRSFTDEVNSGGKDSAVAKHPEDYSLWLLGTFDSDEGTFDGSSKRQLLRGKDAKVQE